MYGMRAMLNTTPNFAKSLSFQFFVLFVEICIIESKLYALSVQILLVSIARVGRFEFVPRDKIENREVFMEFSTFRSINYVDLYSTAYSSKAFKIELKSKRMTI